MAAEYPSQASQPSKPLAGVALLAAGYPSLASCRDAPMATTRMSNGSVATTRDERWECGSDARSDSMDSSDSISAVGDGIFGGTPAPKELRGRAEDEFRERREAAISRLAAVVEKHRMESESRRTSSLQRRHSRSKTLPASFSFDASAAAIARLAESFTEGLEQCPASFDTRDLSCIIFDWDDTLFPTWYAQNVVVPCSAGEEVPVASMFVEPLALFAKVVEKLLRKAREVARVAIVTLAQRPWVETSARTYLPDLHLGDLLVELEIPIYYAREYVKKAQVRPEEEGINMLVVAKRNAMVKCLGRLRKKYGREASNIIAIGDSVFEHEALKEVVWARDGHNLCKSVLLMDKPPVEMLSNELKLLCSSIGKMTRFQDDFYFNMENGSADNFATWLY